MRFAREEGGKGDGRRGGEMWATGLWAGVGAVMRIMLIQYIHLEWIGFSVALCDTLCGATSIIFISPFLY